LGEELKRYYAAERVSAWADPLVPPAALNGYTRALTERGGFLIAYRDQFRNPLLDGLRVVAWVVGTGSTAWLLLVLSPLPFLWCLVSLVLAGTILWLVAFWKIPIWHSIEIYPDGMIVDGRFFSADLIGENWPQLQMAGDDPDRLVLCGIYGTRFVQYATANRLGRTADRTPEILAQDLELAMEQLWGRRDAIHAAPSGD